jgi:hypothetical protein
MWLVIFGPTGGTGGVSWRGRLRGARSYRLRQKPLRDDRPPRTAKDLVGDAFDPGQVREAVAGNEAVISVLGSRQPNTRYARTDQGIRMDRLRPALGTSSRR